VCDIAPDVPAGGSVLCLSKLKLAPTRQHLDPTARAAWVVAGKGSCRTAQRNVLWSSGLPDRDHEPVQAHATKAGRIVFGAEPKREGYAPDGAAAIEACRVEYANAVMQFVCRRRRTNAEGNELERHHEDRDRISQIPDTGQKASHT
jgi:hypothetical protein